MRIVHVYKDYFPPVRGGIEQTIHRMACWQVAAGHEVTVLVAAGPGAETHEQMLDGVRVIRVREWGRALSSPLCPDFPGALDALRADVWHLHSPNPLGEVAFQWSQPQGAMVFTYYCDITRQRALIPAYQPLVHALFRRADVLHAIAPQALERPDSMLAPFRDRFRVVPLGIEAGELLELGHDRPGARALRERYGHPYLLFVGRLRHYKGLHHLLDAMLELDVPLVIVGDGAEEVALKAQATRLGLHRKVTFAGAVSDEVLHDHLAGASIGLLPSSAPTEAFGLAMVEYMAAGLPAICTELGTGTSFVNQHGQTGLVVPPREASALVSAVRRLLADPELRASMGRAGRERVRQLFTTEAMMRGMDALSAEALRVAAGRPHGRAWSPTSGSSRG